MKTNTSQNIKFPKKLMTHVVVGFPTIATTEKVIEALVAGGSTMIELQIPFSDPLADGPTIMHASEVALKNGMTLKKYLDLTKKVSQKHNTVQFISVVYLNTILSNGIEATIRKFKKAGLCGCIIPDLTFDVPEFKSISEACKKDNIELIPVVAPTTTKERLTEYAKQLPKLIYTTQHLGVTGSMSKNSLLAHVDTISSLCGCTVAVGFGIQTPADVKRVANVAGVVVIGSAIVKIIEVHQKNEKKLFQQVKSFVRDCVNVFEK